MLPTGTQLLATNDLDFDIEDINGSQSCSEVLTHTFWKIIM